MGGAKRKVLSQVVANDFNRDYSSTVDKKPMYVVGIDLEQTTSSFFNVMPYGQAATTYGDSYDKAKALLMPYIIDYLMPYIESFFRKILSILGFIDYLIDYINNMILRNLNIALIEPVLEVPIFFNSFMQSLIDYLSDYYNNVVQKYINTALIDPVLEVPIFFNLFMQALFDYLSDYYNNIALKVPIEALVDYQSPYIYVGIGLPHSVIVPDYNGDYSVVSATLE